VDQPKGLIVAECGPHGAIDGPLEAMPLAGRPLIAHSLDALASIGIRDVGVVVSPAVAEPIRVVVRDGSDWGLRVSYIRRSVPLGLVHGLLAARDFLAGASAVVLRGDVLATSNLEQVRDQLTDSAPDAVVLVDRGQDDGARRLAAVPDTVDAGARDLQPLGLLARSDALVGAAADTPVAWHGERELTDVVDRLVQTGGRARAHAVSGWWRFGGSPADLIDGNRIALADLKADYSDASLTQTEVQGAVVIHPTASAELAVIRGPVVIGPRVEIRDAYIGPFTSIGADAVIESAEIEHSLVLPGAHIMRLGRRLESSVIGYGARVSRDFALPRALRLNIGSSAEVCLS
jgi:glucose-1-phosphate thymidylyltransferase